MRLVSTGLKIPLWRNFCFLLLDFFVKICLNDFFLYLTLPVAVIEYRLAALFLVFIFGIILSLSLFPFWS